jgi:cytosol alanyl aminopeptidase
MRVGRVWPWLLLLAAACGPNTDLTVAPPPQLDPSFQVEVPPSLPSGRLPAWASPRRYELRLEIDPGAAQFHGEVFIDVTLEQGTSAIVLHAADLSVERAEIVVGDKRLRAEASLRKAAGAVEELEELVLVASQPIPAGEIQIHIEYQGQVPESLRGIYRVEEDGRWFVFTQFEPADARRMFPCFDDPSFKTPFDLEVTVPEKQGVFSNAPEKERKTAKGKTTVRFAQTKPMPTYLLSLAVGPFEVKEGDKAPVPIRIITVPGRSAEGATALRMASEHLALLAEFFGSPYPYDKLDLIAVPNFGAGAMENAGLVAFREELVLLDPTSSSLSAERDVAVTIAHELSHHWFGNLVTMKWWDDLWLNEGFATFMESLIVDRWRPAMRAELEARALTGWVMNLDALTSARAVRQPVHNTYEAEASFDSITYLKGAAVIHMLESWLGPDAFRAGVQAYLSEHAWRNADAADLFRALGKASGKSVDTVATTFLDASGVPLVRARLVCDGAPKVVLEQSKYRPTPSRTAGAQRWSIPVCVEHPGRTPQARERDCTVLSEPSAELPLTVGGVGAKRCPKWLLPNAGHAGYFRYALPPAELDALAAALKTGDGADTVGFLTNLWAMVQAGEVPADKLLDVLGSYKNEKRPEVIEQLVRVLDRVQDALVEPAGRDGFERLALGLLLPTAKRLGWAGRKGEAEEQRMLRQHVLGALALFTDDPWMAAEAKKHAAGFLAAPGSVDADTATIALRLAARRGDIQFDELYTRLDATSDPRVRIALVQAMGSLGDDKQLRRALDLVEVGGIKSGDVVYIARAAAEHPRSRAVLVGWLREHLTAVLGKVSGFGVVRMISAVERLCDAKSKREAEKMLTGIGDKLGPSKRRASEALEMASLCIDLRGRQAPIATQYFQKLK